MSSKTWCRAGTIAVLSLALSTTIAVAQDHGHGHNKHDRDDDDHGNGHGKGHDKGHGHEAYSDHDRDIHDWYRAHYSDLPPGLAKRDRLPPGLERQLVVRGTLPPGLQKKMQPLSSRTRSDAPAASSELRARRNRWQFDLGQSCEFSDRGCFPFRNQLDAPLIATS